MVLAVVDGNGGDINRMAPNFCKQVAGSCSNFHVRLGESHRFSDGFPVFFCFQRVWPGNLWFWHLHAGASGPAAKTYPCVVVLHLTLNV